MVWHETVRCNVKLLLCRGTQDLRQYEIDRRRGHKDSLPLIGAEREEISIRATIVEILQAFRPAGVHGVLAANAAPSVRLLGAPFVGPAEAGHYVRELNVRSKCDVRQ